MKTIAITIDEETLELIDRLYASSGQFRSRSALVRAAIEDFVEQMSRRLDEERESKIVRENQELLEKQLRALVEEQAT